MAYMAYCTTNDLINRYGEDEMIRISDHTMTGVVDEAVVQTAIDDASVLMDSYLPGNVDVGLNAQNLNRVCADIARYYLYDDTTTTTVEQRYKDAVKWLEQVAKGMVKLAVAVDPLTDEDVPDTLVVFGSEERVFS